MEIETTGAIKLFFPNPSLPLVYFEAIANAIDAGATKISIEINLFSFDKPETLNIKITDNGAGFCDENFNRFKTLLKPRDKYHKGIGRLVFLNYFSEVAIKSQWEDNYREFTFKKGFEGDAPIQKLKNSIKDETSLTFKGFTNKKIQSYEHSKPGAIKNSIKYHFLPTLDALEREGKKFEILVKLNTDESNTQKEFFTNHVTLSNEDLPSFTRLSFTDNRLDSFSQIEMLYHIEQTSDKASCNIAFNIDGRTINTNLISNSAIPHGYSCTFLFESDLFHTNVDSSRQKLILPDTIDESHLYKVLKKKIGRILSEHIPEIKEKNEKTKATFHKQFPHLLGYFDESTIGVINKDEALSSAQQKFFTAEKEILQCEELSPAAYEKSLELSSRVLTEYVLYREKIIKRMKSMTKENSESEIHNLIVPRYSKFNAMENEILYQNNAWLLDDKFMVFRTILSEKRMAQVINAIKLDEEHINDDGRPDIAMIFSADPDNQEHVDVVVVEIKKKTDAEKDNFYAINQLLDRAVKLVAHCNNIQRVWYYAVMDVNDTMATRLEQQRWAPLYSKGHVYYQDFITPHPNGKQIPTPTFVVSFDAIVNDAEARNQTFLDILRDGIAKQINSKDNL